MNLLDSSGWLEYFAGSENADNFSAIAEDFSNLIVPVICVYEVFKKISKERNEKAARTAVNFMMNGTVIDIDNMTAVQAAKLSAKHKLPMADSMIYAIALKHNAVLFTQDIDFQGLDGVKYFAKNK